MPIKKIITKDFRNLSSVQINPGPHFNVLLGCNGSGKTSVLEALYVLAYGRSFRSPKLAAAIQYKRDHFLSCAQVSSENSPTYSLGLMKGSASRVTAKLSGKKVSSLLDLTTHLPALFISPDSFSLLVDGPDRRRKFIDWGAFHCEDGFSAAWQRFSQILKQRNASLKNGRVNDLKAWDHDWVKSSEEITRFRKSYLKKLMPCFKKVFNEICPQDGLSISFWQGWPDSDNFEDTILKLRSQEMRVGHCLSGPQRADLQINLHDYPAAHLLSRGQQKMLVCALYLAQGMVLTQSLNKECVYLVDDLSSELDVLHRAKFLQQLHEIGAQSFITGVESSLVLPLLEEFSCKIYGVDSGVVLERQ